MSEESTTPDLVERHRQIIGAGDRGDLDAAMSMFAPDVVFESLDGIGVFDGATAVRGFLADWLSSYQVFEIKPEEVLDLGGGITFGVADESGLLRGAAGRIEQRSAWAVTWEHGLAVHVIAGLDIDKARAAAERLAEERG